MAGMTVGLTSARVAVSMIFFVNGAILASWVPHIPMVKERLGIGDGQLGGVLLFMAVGALGALPIAGALVSRFGSRAISITSALGLSLTLPWPVLAPSALVLAGALLVFGAFNATLDVAMNVQAVEVEARWGRPIMSSFHALFSAGGLAGAALSAVILAQGVGPMAHALGTALVGSLVIVMLRRHLIAIAPSRTREPVFVRPTRALFGLGMLCFCALLAEGAMGDWSAVYLMDARRTSQSVAAAGFAAFSLAMAVGRLAGDRAAQRLGPTRLLRSSSTLAAVGLLLALLLPSPIVAIIGFGVVGLGVANLIPVLFGAAGRMPGVASGHGLAAVATTGYLGFLAGPPLIGVTAEATGLPAALGIVAAACAAVAIGANAAAERSVLTQTGGRFS
jgi:MFS family permease